MTGAIPLNRITLWCFAGAIAIYCMGHLAWYSTTALGRMPVLDEREILQLALHIARGTLPAEAFYRAPLYPALLALPLWLGCEPALLPLLARALNGVLHLGTAWLAWDIAGRCWGQRPAQYIAAGLIGFNPVLLHFAGDALDITFAMTLLMFALRAIVQACTAPSHAWRAWLRAGGWLGLGTLARPQLLAVVAVLPLLAGALATGRSARLRDFAAATVLPTSLLLAFGLCNAYLAHDFRVLPWQGAYNFWAANRPGAHGRFFEQTLPIHTVDEAANTARLESEILYRRETGDRTGDYRAQTEYWRARTGQAITADPFGWVALVARKAFYLLNNVEQYNNKTYAFHKARSPWLRWNPLGWGCVLGLATLGAAAALRRRAVRALLVCAAAYAGGVLLYYVSDRFRVPLVLFGAVLAGGSWQALRSSPQRARACVLAAMVTAVSCVPLSRQLRTATYVQDYLALGRAHSELGEHAAARAAAAQAVALAPARRAAQALLCVTRFNAWLHAEEEPLPADTLQQWAVTCGAAADHSPAAQRILGYLEWRSGRTADAHRRWQRLVDADNEERAPTLAWLALTGALRASDAALIRRGKFGAGGEALALALAWRGEQTLRRKLESRLPAARLAREFASLERLFGAAIR